LAVESVCAEAEATINNTAENTKANCFIIQL
jgi:hypothetical protein